MKLPLNLEEMKRISKIYIDASVPDDRVFNGSIHAYILKDKQGNIILGRVFKNRIFSSSIAEQHTMDILIEDLNDTLGDSFRSLVFDFYTDFKQVVIKNSILKDKHKMSTKNFYYTERENNWEADLLCHIGIEGVFKYSFKHLFEDYFNNTYLSDSFGGIFNNVLSPRHIQRFSLITNAFFDFKLEMDMLENRLSDFVMLVPFSFSLDSRNFMIKGFISFLMHLESYTNPLFDDSLFYDYLLVLEDFNWDTQPLKDYLSSCLEKSYGV